MGQPKKLELETPNEASLFECITYPSFTGYVGKKTSRCSNSKNHWHHWEPCKCSVCLIRYMRSYYHLGEAEMCWLCRTLFALLFVNIILFQKKKKNPLTSELHPMRISHAVSYRKKEKRNDAPRFAVTSKLRVYSFSIVIFYFRRLKKLKEWRHSRQHLMI